MKFNRSLLALAVAAAMTSGSAMAADPTFATTDVVAGFGIIGGAIALVGAAKLAPAVIAVGWKWLKATVFS